MSSHPKLIDRLLLQQCPSIELMHSFYTTCIDNIYFLGLLKMYGISLSQSDEAAVDYFKRAADLGLGDAQTAYGLTLLKGSGP